MKRLIAAVLLVLATSAQATTFSTDASDLWWNASESGWGVNVIQQEDILFLTFFVYGPNGQAIWYSGSATYTGASNGALVFTGKLQLTTGSWFAAPWNPSSVTYQEVGEVTFRLNTVNNATVTYKVGTTTVVKELTRLMWRYNDIAGNYIGAAIGNSTGCANNGYSEESFFVNVSQNVSQTPATATIALINASGTCTYTGTYSQDGRMGSITGTYSCSNGVSGTFLGYEIEASISGLTVRATTTNGACTWQGRMGGIRRGQ